MDTNNNDSGQPQESEVQAEISRRRRIRSLVKDIAKRVVPRAITSYTKPDAVAEVLKEATFRAVDEVILHRSPTTSSTATTSPTTTDPYARGGKQQQQQQTLRDTSSASSSAVSAIMAAEDGALEGLITQAFAPVEQSLDELESSLKEARTSLAAAKDQAKRAVTVVQAAALAQVEGAAVAVKKAEDVASRKAVAEIYATANAVDVESLAYEDVDFAGSEMTPPFLDDDQCLVPGEPVVRVEKAPENSRRIFAGIDIMASVDTVWDVLTDYANLQNVVPNLEVNQVLKTYQGKNASDIVINETADELDQCMEMANQLNGAVLKQVGKVSFFTWERSESVHGMAWDLIVALYVYIFNI